MTINVGLLGLGNVGTCVARGLMEERVKGVSLTGVLVRDPYKQRGIEVPYLTTHPEDIIYNPDIQIVVEVMGGVEPARQYILEAIKAGKSVVTANKNVIGRHAREIFDAARGKVNIAYEASVGGGIQINNVFQRLAPQERIPVVKAIVNGTTNYILTRMYEGLDFDSALKEAQKLGYAEPDPTFDISGLDARDKLAVLAMELYNTSVNPDDIFHEGLEVVQGLPFSELRRAEDLGYVLKLLAIGREQDGYLDLRVHPTFIRKTHDLASVPGVFNAIYWEGELCGPQFYLGRGAGPDPTESALLSDISHEANNLRRGVVDDLPTLDSPVRLVGKDKIRVGGLLRPDLDDRAGSLHVVTGIATKHNVSINQVLQRDGDTFEDDGKPFAHVAITTYPTELGSLEEMVRELKESDRVRDVKFFKWEP